MLFKCIQKGGKIEFPKCPQIYICHQKLQKSFFCLSPLIKLNEIFILLFPIVLYFIVNLRAFGKFNQMMMKNILSDNDDFGEHEKFLKI